MVAHRRQGEAAEGVKVKPGTQWLKPALVGRVRHLKGDRSYGMPLCREEKG